jgi:peptidoglycan/LPS O-acetylase OafA/YrhL
MSPAAPRGHNPWLDLLRATAIVLVLMRHGAREIGVEGAPVGFRNLMLNGWVGVDLFFVLSGFLIARQLLREIGASGTLDLPRFLLRRGLRIVPAYAAVLALVVLGAFPLYAVNPDNLGLRTVYHLVFLQDYLPADINVVYWSLGVEEKFYLAAPLIVFAIAGAAGARYRAWLLLGGLFLLAPALRAVTFAGLPLPLDYETFFRSLRSPFHACLEPLVLGVAIAVAEAHLPRSARIGGLLLGLD